MSKAGRRSKDMALVALFAALIAVGAYIRIPVPVVPFTLQFLFANLSGLLLGPERGAAAVCLYMAAGLIGAPVFAHGGGPWYVMHPTFGYIAGFAAGAWLAGMVALSRERKSFGLLLAAGFAAGAWLAGRIALSRERKSFGLLLAAGFANIAAVYLFGLAYYWFAASYFAGSPVALSALLLYGLVLAVPGDIALCFVSAALAEKIIPRIGGGSL